MKLDIHKAFDTVNWGLLARDSISALGPVGVSGFPSYSVHPPPQWKARPSFSHARGVRRGDPLSPMLFILAMDHLQRLLDLATQQEILTPSPLTATKWRTSIYADAAIFINPIKEDVEATITILQAFGTFSGLHINFKRYIKFIPKEERIHNLSRHT